MSVFLDGVKSDAGAASSANDAQEAGDFEFNKGADGQDAQLKTLTELLTILAAANTDTVIAIPTGAIPYAVSVRVVTVIPTAATFDVGIAGDLTKFSTGVAVAADTVDKGMADPAEQASAEVIRITPNISPAAATGQVRVTIHYLDVTPPTS